MKARNGNIEILRFLFANLVVWHHALLPVFKGGWLGVEFFFILTGFFMAKGLEKNKDIYANEPIAVTVKEASGYLLKRFMSVFPYMLISTVIGFVVKAFDQAFGLSAIAVFEQLTRLPYDLFFLQNYGYASISCTGTLWYLSAMFFAIWLLYPIMRRHYDLYVGYIAPMVAIFLVGFLLRSIGSIAASCEWIPSGLNLGFVRAVAEVSWGAFLYKISSTLSKDRFSTKAKKLLTLVEAACYVFALAYICVWTVSKNNDDPLIIMVMSVGIVITTSGLSYFHGKFDTEWAAFLGKISMVLYMNHAYWLFHIVSLADRFGIRASELTLKIIGILLSYVTTVIVYYLGNALQRVLQKLMNKLEQCFVPTEV